MSMNNKADMAEDQREISLNETSAKRPLDVLEVIGGHGPWQFRQWLVFLIASFCNASVLFSPLFLPPQTFCLLENSTVSEAAASAIANNTAHSSPVKYYSRNNQSGYNCNASDCTRPGSDVPLSNFYEDDQCSSSQVEIIAKCIYVVSCFLSGLSVYFTTTRFGRRHLALTSCLFLTASSLATSWADVAAAYLILRFLVSFAVINVYVVSAFSLLEYVQKDYKILYFLTGHLGWGLASFFLPAAASLAQDWKGFNIALSVGCFFLWFSVWWGPESPSFFRGNGSHSVRSRKALKYAAFTNGYSTTDVDLLPHSLYLKQEKESDLGTPMSPKQKCLRVLYSGVLFLMSSLTTFLYFSAKWHAEWFKVHRSRVSFSFLGSTEVAGTIILLFLTCVVSIKHLWAFVSLMTSALMVVIYSRDKPGSSTSSAMLYTVTMFFAAASWTLVLCKSFCHKIKNSAAVYSLLLTWGGVITGALCASVLILKADNQDLLLFFGVPHMIIAVFSIFLLNDEFFGAIS